MLKLFLLVLVPLQLGATIPQDYVLTRCLRQPLQQQAQRLDDALRVQIQQR